MRAIVKARHHYAYDHSVTFGSRVLEVAFSFLLPLEDDSSSLSVLLRSGAESLLSSRS